MEIPETRYAKTVDDLWIAYQTVGEGPIDLIVVNAWITHIEIYWEQPRFARMLTTFAKNARVINFDKRGTGLSDRISRVPDLESRMDDIRAVMDAAGSDRAVLFGWGDGAALSSLFAATYPERAAGLILFGGGARTAWAPDYPWGVTEDEWRQGQARLPEIWGSERDAREWAEYSWILEPEDPDDPELLRWVARWARYSAAPGDALAFEKMWFATDVRDILPAIQIPTAVIYREGVNPDEAAWVASKIPGAKLVPLSGHRWVVWMGDLVELGDAVDTFLRSIRAEQAEFERVLATVLFTDIVDSTAQAARLGDHRWREVREAHDRLIRGALARYRGREVKTMGDGFLATFDGPARAVRCAQSIVNGVRSLGVDVRAGLHTGEVELDGVDVAGIGVAIGARVGALAGPSEVLVSSTVKDLVVGSGLSFEDAGEHELKGVPDRWHLYRVVN